MGQMSCGYQCPSLRKWMIKTSHRKGFKPVFKTPELWLCTLSGWGASPISPAVCCRWCSLGNELRAFGSGQTPVLISPDCLCNSCCRHLVTNTATALDREQSPCSATGHVQLVLSCVIAQCQGAGLWHSKLCLPARKSLVCADVGALAVIPSQSPMSQSVTFTFILVLMYTVQSWSSPEMPDRGLCPLLVVALDASLEEGMEGI